MMIIFINSNHVSHFIQTLPNKLRDVRVKRVSEVAPGPVCPLEALNYAVIKKAGVADLGVDVVRVEDVEDGREDGSGGRGRDAVQCEAV